MYADLSLENLALKTSSQKTLGPAERREVDTCLVAFRFSGPVAQWGWDEPATISRSSIGPGLVGAKSR